MSPIHEEVLKTQALIEQVLHNQLVILEATQQLLHGDKNAEALLRRKIQVRVAVTEALLTRSPGDGKLRG